MSAFVPALGWTFLHFLWQGLLVGAGVAVALWVVEGQGARTRYAVACAGLLVLVAAPLCTFLLLRGGGPALPPAPAPHPAAGPGPLPGLPEVLPTGWRSRAEVLLPWLVGLWAAGSLLLASRLAGGWVWLQWLRVQRSTLPAEDSHQLLLLRLCQRMGVKGNLQLLLCRAVPGPTVLGWFRPVILMPPAFVLGLPPDHLERILAHELAHVLRHDYLVNLLQSVVEVLLFFHPAVWWVSARIRQERELACDDLAVRFLGDALDYARALTALAVLAARSGPAQPAPRFALGAQGDPFMKRIHRLITPAAPLDLAPRAGLLILLLASAGFALPMRARVQAGNPAEALAKGSVHLRRYDDDGPGDRKRGSIDLLVHAASIATMERAFSEIQRKPVQVGVPYQDVDVAALAGEGGSLWTYVFTGVDPGRVLTLIRAQAALPPIERKPGLLVLQRGTFFTTQAALTPQSLKLDVWAGDVPAAEVLKALDELEARAPQAGIPQEVRRTPASGSGRRVRLDLAAVDPIELRNLLEKVQAQGD